jgi:sodium-dependent phosphate transporter
MAALPQFYWMTVVAPILGFWYAFGIGANDCANSFATSVAAKSVSLRQAVCIAAICEFGGALLLGASVTNTIRSKVIDVKLYTNDPEVLMYGMLCALLAASVILQISNYLAMPVSTTHTIVGAIVGFSIAAKGFKSINWTTCTQIFISWAASPLVTGLAAYICFWIVRRTILLSPNPYQRAVLTYPIVIFVAVSCDLFFILYKSGTNNDNLLKKLGLKLILPLAFGIGLVCAVVFQFAISPILQRRIKAMSSEEAAVPQAVEVTGDEEDAEGKEVVKKETITEQLNVVGAESQGNAFSKAFTSFADATYNRDVHAEAMATSTKAKELWETAPEFDANAENMFSYLQVFTACLLSFAHGANDVANAIAPLSAIYLIYNTGGVSSKAPVQKWVLVLGGAGIVCGLALYGYKLIVALGFHLTKLSPSRGFCIELTTSFVVVIASFIGLPISTTQCQVGGTVGAGFVTGGEHVNFVFFAKCVLGWILTFVSVCLLTAGIFAFAYFAPSAPGFSVASE